MRTLNMYRVAVKVEHRTTRERTSQTVTVRASTTQIARLLARVEVSSDFRILRVGTAELSA